MKNVRFYNQFILNKGEERGKQTWEHYTEHYTTCRKRLLFCVCNYLHTTYCLFMIQWCNYMHQGNNCIYTTNRIVQMDL